MLSTFHFINALQDAPALVAPPAAAAAAAEVLPCQPRHSPAQVCLAALPAELLWLLPQHAAHTGESIKAT
jgi:hypothetical protein